MKRKTIIISIVVIIMLAALIFGCVVFIKNFNDDKEKTLQIMEKIKEEYKTFSPLVETFSEERSKFYTTKDELFYLDSIDANKGTIYEVMTNYNTLIMNVHTSSSYLQENCQRKYSDSKVNNTCDLFKQGYEAVINYYLTDIGVYNNFVTEYNNWLIEEQLTLEPMVSQEFSLYENYIDYDNDGSYLGGK